MNLTSTKDLMLPARFPGFEDSEFCFVSLHGSDVYHVSPIIHDKPSGTACGTLFTHDSIEHRYSVSNNAPEDKRLCATCAETSNVKEIYTAES